MLFKRQDPAPNPIKIELDRVISEMAKISPDSPEYTKMVVHAGRLHAMLPPIPEKRRPSADAWLNIGGYLANTALVLHHEKLNVITSKVFGGRPPR